MTQNGTGLTYIGDGGGRLRCLDSLHFEGLECISILSVYNSGDIG